MTEGKYAHVTHGTRVRFARAPSSMRRLKGHGLLQTYLECRK